MSDQPAPKSITVKKKPWVKPTLKIISAGSAEADVGGDVQDGAGGNPDAKS